MKGRDTDLVGDTDPEFVCMYSGKQQNHKSLVYLLLQLYTRSIKQEIKKLILFWKG